jgi:hypothetical protein
MAYWAEEEGRKVEFEVAGWSHINSDIHPKSSNSCKEITYHSSKTSTILGPGAVPVKATNMG